MKYKQAYLVMVLTAQQHMDVIKNGVLNISPYIEEVLTDQANVYTIKSRRSCLQL